MKYIYILCIYPKVEMFLLYCYDQDVEETAHREKDIVKIPKNEFNSCYRRV